MDALPEKWSVKALVQKFLSERPHQAGESVEFGWFVFWVIESGKPPRIKTLDFRAMASFTEDFAVVEHIRALQAEALRRFDAGPCDCTLLQTALVSINYRPGRDDAFVERQRETEGNDSGWYVGVLDETADMNDSASFLLQSLYELTINDNRTADWWLLPPGYTVALNEERIQFDPP